MGQPVPARPRSSVVSVLTQLVTLVEQLEAGKGGIVAVEGDAGAGKTRLVEGSAERARAGSDGWKDGRTHLATPRHSPL